MTGVAAVVDRWRRHHEVSILIAAGAGVGRCFGSQPRAKVSMMIMRPPQQGARTLQHARFVERCGPARLGLFGAGRHGEQLARLRDVGARLPLASSP